MRLKLTLLISTCAALHSTSARAAEPAAPTAKPNVLFIAVDDLNHWVGHLGRNKQTKTPNIDRLARMGVTFSNAHCAGPVCNPSRAALLSGKRPGVTGVYDNGQPFVNAIKPAESLVMQFKNAGYETLGIGKLWHGVYPTLCDLAGIAKPTWVEGDNIKPLLADPAAKWGHVAITTYGRNNHAIRTDRWRYIRYADGGEELYDHASDEYEWTNLAAKSEHAALKAELAKTFPATNVPAVKSSGGDGEGTPEVSEEVKAKRKARRDAKAADQSLPIKP